MNKATKSEERLQKECDKLKASNKEQAKTIKIILDLLDDVGICVLVDQADCPDCYDSCGKCVFMWLKRKE